jgi:hypothetical protein
MAATHDRDDAIRCNESFDTSEGPIEKRLRPASGAILVRRHVALETSNEQLKATTVISSQHHGGPDGALLH